MNLLEEIIEDSLKENIAQLSEKANAITKNSPIRQGDDRLQIVAQRKSNKGRPLSILASDYIDRIRKSETHNATVERYYHPETDKYFDREQLTTDDINSGKYRRVFKHTVSLNGDTNLIAAHNCIYIDQYNLIYQTESRFRLMIDAVTKSDLFVHNARTEPIPKNVYNANRNALKRSFAVYEYEWCVGFSPEISAFLRPICKRIAKQNGNAVIDGTAYLSNSDRVRVKFYNVSAAQEERKKQPYEHQPNDFCKLEFTLGTEFFKDNPELRDVSTYKKQNDCHRALKLHVAQLCNKHLLKYLTPSQMRRLFTLAKVNTRSEFMNLFDDETRLETSVYSELQDIKSKIQELAAALEKHTIAMQENTAATNANTAALSKNTVIMQRALALMNDAETSQYDARKKPSIRLVK